MAAVKPHPDGYPQVTPYLCVAGAGAAQGLDRRAPRRLARVTGCHSGLQMPHADRAGLC